MTEIDCIEYLSSKEAIKEARKYFLKEKVAFKVPSKAALIGASIAVPMGVAAQYMLSKPDESGLSKEQKFYRRQLDDLKETEENLKRKGKEPGFFHGVRKAITVGSKELSDTLAKHPKKGAVYVAAPLAASIGSRAGMSLAKFFKAGIV